MTFFDGNEILSQFAEFCPERNAVEEFLRTSTALQDQLKGVEVSAKVVSGVRELLFRPTEGAAESENWLLQLDLNLEAINEEMRARFRAFDEEGGSICLPKAVFKIVSLPQILEQLGMTAQHIGDLSFTQIPKEIGTFTFRKSDEQNNKTSLEHIALSVNKSGRRSIPINNQRRS